MVALSLVLEYTVEDENLLAVKMGVAGELGAWRPLNQGHVLGAEIMQGHNGSPSTRPGNQDVSSAAYQPKLRRVRIYLIATVGVRSALDQI